MRMLLCVLNMELKLFISVIMVSGNVYPGEQGLIPILFDCIDFAGGRQLDGAPSALETLFEIRKYAPQVFKTCEVYLDGGIRRGTDVLKALCLGATAVGIGRPCEYLSAFRSAKIDLADQQITVMYSLIFGDEGVATVATILRDELAQNLRLLGAQKLSDLNPRMVSLFGVSTNKRYG